MINLLPFEIVEYIAEYLDPESTSTLEGVCKHTNNVNFGRYWKRIFIETFPGKNPHIYPISLMKSLICTRMHLTDLKKDIISLKRAVDIGTMCDFTNWISLNLSIQAAVAPFSILFLAPLTIMQIRDFYEHKRNTPPVAQA